MSEEGGEVTRIQTPGALADEEELETTLRPATLDEFVGQEVVREQLAVALEAASSLALGVSELTVASALEDARPVTGRLELVEAPLQRPGRVRVFVDYAHTPDALDKVCGTLRELTEGRLRVVFGCGGDRDRTKRAPMTAAVVRHAHAAYMTSDNPRKEEPDAILDDMAVGLAGSKAETFRIVDRAEAIRRAVSDSEPGDTILIAGKGHETYQIFKDSVVPFDDRQEASRALAAKEAGWLHR